jgi:hypothetical protein
MKKLLLPLCLLFFAQGCIVQVKAVRSSEPIVLNEAVQAIDFVFKSIQNDMDNGTDEIADAGTDTAKISRILKKLCRKHPYAIDVAFINPSGIIQVVEPSYYKKLQGTDISWQEHIKKMLIDKQPSMSWVFQTVEGYWAVSVQYPVLDDDDVYLGSLSMLLRPESLLKNIIEPKITGVPVDLWVMEPAGRIIYDPDREEIGRNIFLDDLYKPFPNLLDAARTIASSPQGMKIYDFLGKGLKESVKKYAYWKTVSIHGIPWRIVLTKAEKEGVNGKKTLEELGLTDLNEAFRQFVALDEICNAIEVEDKLHLLSLLEEFYSNNPGLYSVQWVDETVITRFGFPAENSLENYRFDQTKDTAQADFIRAVKLGKEAFVENTLFEGSIGQMLLIPVKCGGDYRGMIYYIRIKP